MAVSKLLSYERSGANPRVDDEIPYALVSSQLSES